MTVRTLASLLRQLYHAIRKDDRRIAELLNDHPDAFIVKSFPGAGKQYTPRLLVAFGSDRSRHQHAGEIQCFSGIAPVLERSGKMTWVHWRWQRPVLLSQTSYEFAETSVNFSTWAKAYAQLQKARGESHHATIRALAFKWIRITFRCWQQRCAYDESVYMAALRKQHSLLLEYLPNPQPQPITL